MESKNQPHRIDEQVNRFHKTVTLRTFFSLFVLACLLLYLLQTSPVLAQTTIEGLVIEEQTDYPLENTTVMAWKSSRYQRRYGEQQPNLLATTLTDSAGHFRFEVANLDNLDYLLVYYDDPSSNGIDNIPAKKAITRNVPENLTISLVPAASILFEGDIRFIDSETPPSSFSFTVINSTSNSTYKYNDSINVYGTSRESYNDIFGLTPLHVIIPSETNIDVKVDIQVKVGKGIVTRTFMIPERFNLPQGQSVIVDINKLFLDYNMDLAKDHVTELENILNETEKQGFYVILEKRDFTSINALIEEAEDKLSQGLYEECYADLRESYIQASYLKRSLGTMQADAYSSTFILLFFFALTSIVLAYLFFDGELYRALTACIIYSLILLPFYLIYPGSAIVDVALFFTAAIISLSIGFFLTFILPKFIKEESLKEKVAFRSAVTVVFSIAKRSLLRRRLRFTLTLTSVTVMVMSFVALTSYTSGYGLTSNLIDSPILPSNGLLIRKPLPPQDRLLPIIATFTPLSTSDIDWLKGKADVSIVAPKLENTPQMDTIGNLALTDTLNHSIPLFGALGIIPSAESKITKINDTIVAGRFLIDGDENVVLVSSKAAEQLNITIGETLLLNLGDLTLIVELVGIFDDTQFSQLIDLDGAPLIPRKVEIVAPGSGDTPTLYSTFLCDSSEIIVTTSDLALTWGSWLRISRIDTQIFDDEEILSLSRRLALERDYWVWSSVDNQVIFEGLTTFIEVKGFPILVPWIIVILNVIITMLNVVFERRREMYILSAVGLNPTHITLLFVAEAAIIGIIGSGIGYLGGLGFYQLMSITGSTVEVQQKVSALWSLGALGVSAITVITGALLAMRGSVSATPSLLRKWKLNKKLDKSKGSWILPLPIEVNEKDIDSFIDYIYKRFMREREGALKGEPNMHLFTRVKTIEEEIPVIKKGIMFIHILSTTAGSTVNELIALKEEEVYTQKLVSKGIQENVNKTAIILRMILLNWIDSKKI